MKIHFEKETLQAIYLDWVHNFGSTWRFAEHYHISLKEAWALIDICRRCHHKLLKGERNESNDK